MKSNIKKQDRGIKNFRFGNMVYYVTMENKEVCN